MTTPESICAKVNKDIRPQAETLAKAVFAMQEKIEQQIPIYNQMPLAQQVTVGTGETILRGNPATQEFRAMVKDYAAMLDTLDKLSDGGVDAKSFDDVKGKLLKFEKKYKKDA